ncbi:glycosyltransferase family 2 protein [Falsigemmobacter faecalis]|uniref:Glycosyltransferase family 2 protein n=1 Tax=Falsigemmobacter faecalis TaxID=2488730 RepID=A0A3P3DKS4_9RHOB|nr:glycosyltransferase family 2 protein [Falsigemmobacter faecalis]RRH74765.1 glycosyltransferase family 2 protein [Falsigemmobacter faecalis]
MPQNPDPALFLRRPLRAQPCPSGAVLLDRIADAREPGRLRLIFGRGSTEDQVRAALPGAAKLKELREISGSWLADLEAAPPGDSPDERGVLAGCNVVLGFRVAETATMIRDWLLWHAEHHGLSGALIVNRAPPGSETDRFAAELEALLQGVPLRILLVEPDFPTGKPDLGPESHPFLAPDAPGKDRMTPPEPDPFRSPLGEMALPEALKWRFLRQARAVALLDPCDYLPPRAAGEADLFTRTTEALQGVILLIGQRIYPWRIRPGAEPVFGDHICRQFDTRHAVARWTVAPERAGLEKTWRIRRVAYARPDRSLVAPFLRAMALRIPDRGAGELAPKTSLVEDPVLLEISTARLGHKPVRPPVSEPPALLPLREPRTAIVTTMKNEAPFILEWLAWHRAIGVTDFLVYTNDCTDGTDSLLEMLQRKGLVQHRANPWVPGGELKPQHAALQAAESEPVIRQADWAICMDVDEFINIKLGDGRLPTLFAAMEEAAPGANMISLTWRLFGNGDVAEFEDRFMVGQFPLCAPELIRKPHQAWGFKTLFRNIDIFKKLGVHRPKGLRPDLWDRITWLTGSGKRMPKEIYRNGWRSTNETWGYDWVQLNHYAVRSAESFLVKRDRGRVNHVDRDQGLHYWFRMNHNVVEDQSLHSRLPMLQAEWDRLMADPETRAAHEDAVRAHRAKIAELRATAKFEEFYQDLTGERLKRLSRLTPHFGGAVFTAGPGVIPDHIAFSERLPKGFHFTIDDDKAAETAEDQASPAENA